MGEYTQLIMERMQARFDELQKRAADQKAAALEYQAETSARIVKAAKLREVRLAKAEYQSYYQNRREKRPVSIKSDVARRRILRSRLWRKGL